MLFPPWSGAWSLCHQCEDYRMGLVHLWSRMEDKLSTWSENQEVQSEVCKFCFAYYPVMIGLSSSIFKSFAFLVVRRGRVKEVFEMQMATILVTWCIIFGGDVTSICTMQTAVPPKLIALCCLYGVFDSVFFSLFVGLRFGFT